MMKKLLLILLCLPIIGFAQSKKKQIESLRFQLDSINYLLDETNRDFNEMKVLSAKNYEAIIKKNGVLNSKNSVLNSKIDSFKVIYDETINKYKKEVSLLNTAIDSLKSLTIDEISLNENFYGSQSNSFLTKLYLDSTKISNQNFKLELVGVVNKNAQKIVVDNDYYSNNKEYMSEILYLDELLVAQQFKSEKTIDFLTKYNSKLFEEKCSWNWTGNNTNLKMVSPYSLDYFPTFSFLKGKLLTIKDTDASSKDYLFTVSKSYDEYINYGHKEMQFNLTDDDENGYTINTIIIDEQAYIILNIKNMTQLGFNTRFTANSQFKLICGGEDWTGYNVDNYNISNFQNCVCKCETNYLSLYKIKTKYMDTAFKLVPNNLNYLFKLVEQ